MAKGMKIGYDLNEESCQISYYDEELREPVTLEAAAANYQIPLMIGYHDGSWFYGKSAKRLSVVKEGFTAGQLLSRAVQGEKLTYGGKTYEGVWLLTKFIELSLKQFEEISTVTFTLSTIDEDMVQMFRGIAPRIGLDRKQIYVQDYKESFCYYMFYQPKELWQYESALFYCDRKEIRAYMLRRLHTAFDKGREPFVTVDEVANAKMKELQALYPVLNVDKAKDADAGFRKFIQGVFEKKLVSSVYLTGDGFDNNWYPNSLKVLCNGRRVFQGNNLFSKGACYLSCRKEQAFEEGPVYLDDGKMTEQISFLVRQNGKDVWQAAVVWGAHWYESDRQWEALLTDDKDIEIKIESLASGETRIEKIPLAGLSVPQPYMVRVLMKMLFLDERTLKIQVEDVGLGELFPSSGFRTEKLIRLGGSNGEFNSLS
ncbi:MAG TPA: hypothetical protein DCZ20_05695 [Lachnospiraceae bacterium]|nr:hypothetical protein [Lachnospiraceae bacterium]